MGMPEGKASAPGHLYNDAYVDELEDVAARALKALDATNALIKWATDALNHGSPESGAAGVVLPADAVIARASRIAEAFQGEK